MVIFPEYSMLLFSVLEPLYMPKCKRRSWRGLPVPLTGKSECSNWAQRQINSRNVASIVLPTPCWPLKWRSSLGAGWEPPAQQCGLTPKDYQSLDRRGGREKRDYIHCETILCGCSERWQLQQVIYNLSEMSPSDYPCREEEQEQLLASTHLIYYYLSSGPARGALLPFPAWNVMGFLKVLLTQSFIIGGDVAMGKWAGILPRDFVRSQKDMTRDEMIDLGWCLCVGLIMATTGWLLRVERVPILAECAHKPSDL